MICKNADGKPVQLVQHGCDMVASSETFWTDMTSE